MLNLSKWGHDLSLMKALLEDGKTAPLGFVIREGLQNTQYV